MSTTTDSLWQLAARSQTSSNTAFSWSPCCCFLLLSAAAFNLFILQLSGILHYRCVGLRRIVSMTQLSVSLLQTLLQYFFLFFTFFFCLNGAALHQRVISTLNRLSKESPSLVPLKGVT